MCVHHEDYYERESFNFEKHTFFSRTSFVFSCASFSRFISVIQAALRISPDSYSYNEKNNNIDATFSLKAFTKHFPANNKKSEEKYIKL